MLSSRRIHACDLLLVTLSFEQAYSSRRTTPLIRGGYSDDDTRPPLLPILSVVILQPTDKSGWIERDLLDSR